MPQTTYTSFEEDPEIPEYIRPYLSSFDPKQWRWDQNTLSLVDRTSGGGSHSFADIPDPSKGTDVVTDLSGYNRNGPSDAGTFHFEPGVNPFIAFPGESYDAGLVPNSGIFLSADQDEIAEYGDARRDRDWQGIARVGAVVGGAAALGATPWGQAPVGGTGSATVSGTNALAGAVPAAETAAPAGIVGPGPALGGMGSMPVVGGAAGAAAPAAVPPAAVAPAATRGIGSFLRNNRDIIGSVIGGIGEGMAADRAAENDLNLIREREALTRQNYTGADPGRTFRGIAPGRSSVNPVERFDRYSGWEYVWDAQQGRIVKQPIQPLAQQPT